MEKARLAAAGQVHAALGASGEAPLLAALQQGDPAAIAVMWARYAGMVRGILRRLLGPDQEVDDLLQETFLQLHRQARTLRDPNAVRMFLIKIATNVVRIELRRRRVRRLIRPTQSGRLPEVPIRESDLDARAALMRFYRILDTLSARDRTVFVLRFIEDLELAEVAEALGVSLATVKRHLAKVGDRVFKHVDRDGVLTDFLGRKGGGDVRR